MINSIKKALNLKEHTNIKNVGKYLYYGKSKKEGYWELLLEKTEEVIFRTDNEEIMEEQASYIESLCNWDKVENLNHIKLEAHREYKEFINIQKKYGCENIYNGLYYKTLENNIVEYKIRNSVGDKKIKGISVVDGIAVHKNGNMYSVYKVYGGEVITELSTEEKAIKMANIFKDMINFKNDLIFNEFKNNNLIKEYLVNVKNAIENNLPIPIISEELETELLYLGDSSAKERQVIFKAAMKELNSLYGMEELKSQINDMVNSLKMNQRLKLAGVKTDGETLHTIFYGPAGTGKTHVARIMGKLLYAMGYLKEIKMVETTADNMIAGYVGQTSEKTQEFIDKAMGGVLFIDEAYGFSGGGLKGDNGSFGDEAIRVILAAAENRRNDFCIIMAGYEKEMDDMLAMNEGMESRFPNKNRYYFRDYTPKQLALITRDMILKDNYEIGENEIKELENQIKEKSKSGSLNGNARWARNFKEEIISKHKKYISTLETYDNEMIRKITIDSIKTKSKNKINDSVEGLKDIKDEAVDKIEAMIGLSSLKTNIKEMMNYLDIQKMKFEKGLSNTKPNMHMIFSGPPGTGKTTVAEHVGLFLKGSGMLSNGHFVQISATDLTKDDPAKSVPQIVKKAIGGILFIDEAYSLCNDSRGKKASDVLIQEMENNREDFVVILAGYENEMKEMLELNPGFESRIVNNFLFPNYTPDEILSIIKIELNKKKLILQDNCEQIILEKVKEINSEKGSVEGNGRWARNFVEKLEMKQSNRLIKEENPELEKIKEIDVFNTISLY